MSSHRTVEVPKAVWTVTRAGPPRRAGKAPRDRGRVAVHREVDVGDARIAAQEVADRAADQIEREAGDASSAASSVLATRSGIGTAAWR